MHRLLLLVRTDATPLVEHLKVVANEFADGLHVLVLNVQPKPVQWQTRGMFREAIKSHLLERGHLACSQIETNLKRIGISFETRVELGSESDVVLQCASKERCTGILLRADRLNWGQRLLLNITGCAAGSVAGRLIHSSNVPVTVVH